MRAFRTIIKSCDITIAGDNLKGTMINAQHVIYETGDRVTVDIYAVRIDSDLIIIGF